jgi:hypothetical protein
VASLAANADELKANVFTLLDIPGVSDTGDIAPAAKASQKERSDALRITAKVRTIWEDACKSTGDSAELVANGEKEASVAETDAPGADLPEWTVTLEKSQEWSSWGLGVEARLHYIEITEVQPHPSNAAAFNKKNPADPSESVTGSWLWTGCATTWTRC